jgi:hypothetical protein
MMQQPGQGKGGTSINPLSLSPPLSPLEIISVATAATDDDLQMPIVEQ